MFDRRAFRTWPRIAVGALSFGALFALVILLADALFEEGFRVSSRVLFFGAGAAAGYLGVALLVRASPPRSG